MGPQQILGAHGRHAWGHKGSWGHSGGAHGAQRYGVLWRPNQLKGGDQTHPVLWACYPTWADALINLCFMLIALDGA